MRSPITCVLQLLRFASVWRLECRVNGNRSSANKNAQSSRRDGLLPLEQRFTHRFALVASRMGTALAPARAIRAPVRARGVLAVISATSRCRLQGTRAADLDGSVSSDAGVDDARREGIGEPAGRSEGPDAARACA